MKFTISQAREWLIGNGFKLVDNNYTKIANNIVFEVVVVETFGFSVYKGLAYNKILYDKDMIDPVFINNDFSEIMSITSFYFKDIKRQIVIDDLLEE